MSSNQREIDAVRKVWIDKFEKWTSDTSVSPNLFNYEIIPKLIRDCLKKAALIIADLNCTVQSVPSYGMNAGQMMSCGVPIFNAIIISGLSEEQFGKISFTVDSDIDLTVEDYRNALGIVEMNLIIRASMPNWTVPQVEEGIFCPKFIKNQYRVTEASRYYNGIVASFDIHKLGFEWLKSLTFDDINPVFKNRISSGIAGYRLLRFIANHKPDHPEYNPHQEHLKSLFDQGLAWDIHPLTRTVEFVQEYGGFSAELGQLLIKAYSRETLESATQRREINHIPEEDVSRNLWRSWKKECTFVVKHPLFRKD